MDDDPDVIWLGPKCENHEREGRTWSTEPHDCPDCDEKAVKYIRAPIANGPTTADL
jgi:ribosomal protein L37AE/L43A